MGVSRRSRVPERITRPDERFDSSQVGLKGLNCELFGGPSQYEGRIVERYLASKRVATTHTSPTQIAVRHAAQSKCASDGSRPIPG